MLEKSREMYRKFGNKTKKEGFLQASYLATRFVIKKTIKPVARRTLGAVVQPPSIYLHSRLSDRWNVFNKEWDLLIILDTCRPDALRHLADEYEFINGEVNSRWSVGASSPEWMANTLDRRFQDDIAETAYINSNPHAVTVLEKRLKRRYDGDPIRMSSRNRLARYCVNDWITPDEFHTYIPLYHISGDFDKVKHPSPRAVTDHVIKTDREDDPDRIIAHYMPPHDPYIAKARDDGTIDILDEKRSSTFEAYLDNLRWVLNEVEIILSNADRERVIISADHGENFWLRGIIRAHHRDGMIDPTVRRVPWVETSASDLRSYEPDLSVYDDRESISVKESLEALGYLK